MPFHSLHRDVFLHMAEFLEWNDIAKVSTMNKNTYKICNEYVQYKMDTSLADMDPLIIFLHSLSREQSVNRITNIAIR